jgi:DNA-binding XRE family transcriptional regulator
MGVPLWIHLVDGPTANRDDPAVADLSNRVGTAFGAKLLAARERAGLTQEELGYLSTINPAQISQLELGNHTPRLDTLLKLAGGLRVEPCELIGDIRFKPPVMGPDKGGWVDT